MDFKDNLFELSKKIERYRDKVTNEEMTKTAFILPFFDLLGYDTRNPFEFQAEFTADLADSKGEKVDYAILIDDVPKILIEAKEINDNLEKHDKQLMRYFHTTPAKIGILTNGIKYKFFTDLEEPNKMDSKPFLEVNMDDIRDPDVVELKKFFKNNFDENDILTSAEELKYSNAIKKLMKNNFENPSENFVTFVLSEVYEGVKTQKVKDKFYETVKKSVNQLLNEMVRSKLEGALEYKINGEDTLEEVEEQTEERILDTTQEELEGFAIIKAIAHEFVENINEITYKDTTNYFNVLINDNTRKWLCRLYFNSDNKYLALPIFEDGVKSKKENKILLENGLNELYKYKNLIRESYENNK